MKQYQSVRLFKNPVLESLTHVHPSVPFVLWIPVVLYFLYLGFAQTEMSAAINLVYIALGIGFWSLTEYAMHRYVFHFDAKSKAGKYLVFLFHGIHHDDPQDPTRLVMPPVVSIALAIPFYYLYKSVLGAEACMPFFSGFMIGYLIYDYIHFATHHFMFKSNWFKTLKENHMKHHFMAKKGKWGVSTPMWDYVFGTFKQE
jgi:sterol desaturase/sphingolipid hydroxylase (fatty acid hydroxylase superfamily)